MNAENDVLQPAVVVGPIDLSPPTTMLAASVGGAAAGVPGALVATPLFAATKAMYLEVRFGARPEDDGGGGDGSLPSLVTRLGERRRRR